MTAKFDWTVALPSLAKCGVLPDLPPLADLRAAAQAALIKHEASLSADSAPKNNDSGFPLFPSQHLYDALRRCIEVHSTIPPRLRSSYALLLASSVMEDYVRSHGTRAKLAAAHHARAAETAEQATAERQGAPNEDAFAGVGAGSGEAGDGSGGAMADIAGDYSAADEMAPDVTPAAAGEGADRTGDAQLTESGRKRKLAGDTLQGEREGKCSRAGERLSVHLQRLPQLPPLRAYQRDVAGMVLASWGLPLTEQLLGGHDEGGGGGGGGEGSGPMDECGPASEAGDGIQPAVTESAAELQARFRSLADNWWGNWLVSAPTNSGKTRMFVEVARGVTAAKPIGRGAIVLVLVPNIILTWQHAAYFVRTCLPNTLVGAYSSENQLTARAWQEAVHAAASQSGGHSTVLVATSASFLNLLRQGAATIAQVDLLVLDEAHHCKEDHPYAQVISFYDPATAATRVLGLTASPTSEVTMDALALRMSELLGRLGARLHVVDAEDPDVAAAVPEPQPAECSVTMRTVDIRLAEVLKGFGLNAALELGESLAEAQAEGEAARAALQTVQQQLDMALVTATATTTESSAMPRADPITQWLVKGREFAAKYGCPNLDLACRLLEAMRKAVELVEDAGFEGALPFLARKAAALCRAEVAANGKHSSGGSGGGGTGGGGAGPKLPAAAALPPAAPASLRGLLFAAAAAKAAAAAAAAAGGVIVDAVGATGPAGQPQAPVAVAAAAAPALTRLRAIAAPGSAADTPAAPEESAAAKDAAVATASGRGSEGGCTDIPLRVSKLVRELLVEGGDVQFLSSPEAADLVRDCFGSGELKEERTFPKLWALVRYLQGYRDRDLFHGIIFVRTRQAVFHVADMIRRTQQLQFMEVFELIGHNATTKRGALGKEPDRHGRGMSDHDQQEVLRVFKKPGRKVLIATSAAEEGLDVPSCEFVVRYNAAATGIQLLQSRGRARRKVAEFFAILQCGTTDTQLHAKSQLEEANMRAYQRSHTAAAAGGVA